MVQQTDPTWVNIQKIGIVLGILGALFSIGFTLYRHQQERIAAQKQKEQLAAEKLQSSQQTSSFAGKGSAHKKMIVNKVI